METINLNRLAYFAAVVDAGSFTKAAERLGITKTVVSQQVARLEAELKTTLLLRTTRRVGPTEAGRLLYTRCAMILSEAEDAFGELAQANAEPIGILRIAAPNDYGTSRIAPLAAEFSRRYPACRVDLVLSDAKTDLVADQIDLSIRVGWLSDSSLQARRIGTFRQVLVASRNLTSIATLQAPDDLASMPFIANGALSEPLVWRFSENDFDHRAVRMRKTLSINTTPGVLAATLARGGIAILPDFIVTEHVNSGELTHLLPSWTLPSGGIYVVYPAARFRPQKVATFVTMLSEELRRAH